MLMVRVGVLKSVMQFPLRNMIGDLTRGNSVAAALAHVLDGDTEPRIRISVGTFQIMFEIANESLSVGQQGERRAVGSVVRL